MSALIVLYEYVDKIAKTPNGNVMEIKFEQRKRSVGAPTLNLKDDENISSRQKVDAHPQTRTTR